MNNQKDIEKKQTVEPLDFDVTLQIIESSVEQKNSDMKVFIPALLAVVISIISYLFLQNYSDSSLIYACLVFAYVIIAFLALLFAYFPQITYKEPSIKSLMNHMVIPFIPWRLDSYIRLSDDVFVEKFEYFIERKCTPTERMKLYSLKQQINELRHKHSCIKIAYGIIFWGGVGLGVLMILGAIFIQNGLL